MYVCVPSSELHYAIQVLNLWEFASDHLHVLGIIPVLYVGVVVLMKSASYDHVYAVIVSSLGG